MVLALLHLFAAGAWSATLSDPQVDQYNMRIGTQTFAGLYQFTTNTLLVETAQAIQSLGSDTIKMYLGFDYPRQYHLNLPANVTNLLTLARDEPSTRRVLDMPFRHIIAWAYSLSVPDAPFVNSTDVTNDYREINALTRYLLTNYNNSGKTFYLGHWEGDGYFTPWTTNPSPTKIQQMITWLNNRQKAVDDAKASTSFSNVNVYCYAEVNRVLDAMNNGPANNQRMINMVVPFITNLDFVSYSSYDAMDLPAAGLYATLDYIESKIPTNKLSAIPGERLWIGEYGWGGSQSTDQQEPTTRAYIQRLLNYSRKDLPYILFWEIYDNETNKLFCLIDSNNVKVASYYLHQRFINNGRLLTAQFKERNARLPSDSEFVSLVSPMLNGPLSAPVPLSVSNLGSTVLGTNSASVSGQMAQGIYGDQQAAVWLFWGKQNGGTVRGAWESSQNLGLNTNFNPATFTAVLTNLAPQTNYFYRFYATNASGEAWAPASSQFSVQVLDPQAFGSRMKISFTGYNRTTPLAHFPVLVNLGPGLPGFSYRQFASPSGGDLRFTDASGVIVVPHEIDEWNASGISVVWVQVPLLSGTNTCLWAYWGNPLATNVPASSTNGAVWSPNFDLVWHLKENGIPYRDSTGEHPALSGVAPAPALGLVGHAALFNGTTQYLDAGPANLGTAFTLSAWIKVDPSANSIQTIWANKTGGWNTDGFAFFVNSFQTNDGKLLLETGDGTTGLTASTAANAVSFGQWHRVAASVDEAGGTARLFVDGADVTQAGAVVTDFANQADLNLGRFTDTNFFFRGTLDEARIEAGTSSADSSWASWATVASSASFAGYAAVIPQLPVLSADFNAGNLILNWPAFAVGYSLYTATNLAAPVTWLLVTNQPALINGQWQVNLSPGPSSPQFFRLQF